MIPWLDRNTAFPPVEQALREPSGLLAAGGDLSVERLLAAYQRGIFPWFSDGDPILWWSPDPRMVLFPAEFKLSRSLRKRLCRGDYAVRLDGSFEQVVSACANTPRAGQDGTWITSPIRFAYRRLFELGVAHSVETWQGGNLVGGLYGVALGKVFFGESMFAHATDASKIALAHLVRFLMARNFRVIDCQMNTAHLASLGAREIPRAEFAAILAAGVEPVDAGRWEGNSAQGDWRR